MTDTTNSTAKSNVIDIKTAFAKAKPKAKKAPLTSTWQVRGGTAAVCLRLAGDVVAGVLFHALLETWVTSKGVMRTKNGETYKCLIMSSDELETLSGLTRKQIKTSVSKLAATGFVTFGIARIAPNRPNGREVRIHEEAVWLEIASILKPTKTITTNVHGENFTEKVADTTNLPLMFKRLHDAVNG